MRVVEVVFDGKNGCQEFFGRGLSISACDTDDRQTQFATPSACEVLQGEESVFYEEETREIDDAIEEISEKYGL